MFRLPIALLILSALTFGLHHRQSHQHHPSRPPYHPLGLLRLARVPGR